MTCACFPNVFQFPIRKRCFQCKILFSGCKLCLRYTAGNFYENPNMRALAKKIVQARAREHSSSFCKQFEQRPIFLRALSIWTGSFDTPWYEELEMLFLHCHYTHAIQHSMICIIIILETQRLKKWKPEIFQEYFGSLVMPKTVNERLGLYTGVRR